MITIGITTFKRRLEMVSRLIESIKQNDPEIEIILTVNADYKEKFDEEYRRSICELCMNYSRIFPIIFPTFTSLSKMWNSIVINASNEYVLMLNDDLIVENANLIKEIEAEIEKRSEGKTLQGQLFKINHSFSHFVCSKSFLDDIGYFDERLLAFGEEDGDLVWRYIEKYKEDVPSVEIEGISNIGEGYMIANQNMQIENVENYRLVPLFNRQFIDSKYKRSLTGIKGMFQHKMKRVKPDEKQYPYESFKRSYFENL